MSERTECRNCGAKLRGDKTLDQYDPEYCSGKCRKTDGAEPYVKTAAEKAAVVEVVKKQRPASLEDYKKNVPSKYARRHQAEKLNWSANEMNAEELEQAGFRANRKPIPGDWDFEAKEAVSLPEDAFRTEEEVEGLRQEKRKATEWDKIRAQAKDLGIKVFGKTRDVVEAEIKEATNEE